LWASRRCRTNLERVTLRAWSWGTVHEVASQHLVPSAVPSPPHLPHGVTLTDSNGHTPTPPPPWPPRCSQAASHSRSLWLN
jgi:hypothetical protein